MNDRERRLWVLNDAELYMLWMDSKLGLSKFLIQERETIDDHINKQLAKEPHA